MARNFSCVFTPDGARPKQAQPQQQQQAVMEEGFARLLKPTNVAKAEVHHRNLDRKIPHNDAKNLIEEVESSAKKEGRMLRMIQVQVWIRMMVWALLGNEGWEFLKKVMVKAEGGNEKETREKDKGEKVSLCNRYKT